MSEIQIIRLNQSQLASLFRAHLTPRAWTFPDLRNEFISPRVCLETPLVQPTAELHIDSQGYTIPSKTLPLKNPPHPPQPLVSDPPNKKQLHQTQSSSNSTEIIKELITDQAVKDGFKWRKYGQKPVKNSPYPRHYYKCTIEGCTAKKHVETFTDHSGQVKYKSIFIGEHMHDSPEFHRFIVTSQDELRNAVVNAFSLTEDYVPTEPTTGKRKRNTQPKRLEVECSENINVMKDGYKWRKYGQKHVKGSTFPRAYYKCMPPGSIKCNVKKMVEKTDQDTTLIIYEGSHTHCPPPENLTTNFRK